MSVCPKCEGAGHARTVHGHPVPCDWVDGVLPYDRPKRDTCTDELTGRSQHARQPRVDAAVNHDLRRQLGLVEQERDQLKAELAEALGLLAKAGLDATLAAVHRGG